MSNQLNDLLSRWLPQRDSLEWVLGTIIHTEGSSYRKAGAMLLINSLGQYDGLLSGGCLESDIMRQAKHVMFTGTAKIIQYDMQEEDDIGWKLGIGCGGLVKILLQPVNRSNAYQGLLSLHQALDKQLTQYVCIDTYAEENTQTYPTINHAINVLTEKSQKPISISQQYSRQLIADRYLVLTINPTPHIAIFGGGVDARPLVKLAAVMGWKISLFDHRLGYARPEYFKDADLIYRQSWQALSAFVNHSRAGQHQNDIELKPLPSNFPLESQQQTSAENAEQNQQPITECDSVMHFDAAVVMGHNIEFDAEAIRFLQSLSVNYLGLLGPEHRKDKVLKATRLTEFNTPIAGPAGLNLGGELPESIALSILSEIHAFLAKQNAKSFSNILNADSQGFVSNIGTKTC